MFNRTTAALGGIFLVVLAAGLAMIPANRNGAYLFFGADFVFGFVVLILTAASDHRYRRTRNALGKLLSESEELTNRQVVNEEQYVTWKRDFNSWFERTDSFLTEKLSATHAAMFRDLSEGGLYKIPSLNREHEELLNALRVCTRNLRGIIDRYLTTRS